MEEILRLENVTRIKNENVMLSNINMHIFKGEVMGLVCINFHGQKELTELLYRNLPLHYGKVYYNEMLVNSYVHPSRGQNRIAIIEKRSRLVEDLTVADNIYVLRRGFRKYVINRKMLREQLKQFTGELGIEIDGGTLIKDLKPFEKILVELLRAVIMGTKLIIIDDISTLISSLELKAFQHFIRHYARNGFSFFYVCNHHEEAFKVCDRVSIMENGQILKVLEKRDFSREKMEPFYVTFTKSMEYIEPGRDKQVILRFEHAYKGRMRGLDLRVVRGECTVIMDVDNLILQDLLLVMRQETELDSGGVYFEGERYAAGPKGKAVKKSICFIDQHPIENMVFEEMSYLDNLCFLLFEKMGWLNVSKGMKKSITKEYEAVIGEDIHARDVTCLRQISLYSMIYYRVHLYNPKMVFLLQPLSDADMYGRLHILHLIRQLKKKGITVVILTVNLSDSLMVADRLIQVEQGWNVTEYLPQDFYRFDQEATTPKQGDIS